MTQEEKQLLLKDLCARLPYGVKFGTGSAKLGRYDLTDIDVKKEKVKYGNGLYADLERCKPFLRPMSSMTEEKRNEYINIIKNTIEFYNCPKSEDICFLIVPIDWLNSHHFDYRGLIERGLAIEAPEGMYNL